jgi:hypothetical protein
MHEIIPRQYHVQYADLLPQPRHLSSAICLLVEPVICPMLQHTIKHRNIHGTTLASMHDRCRVTGVIMDEYMCAMAGSSPPHPDVVPAFLAEALRAPAQGKKKPRRVAQKKPDRNANTAQRCTKRQNAASSQQLASSHALSAELCSSGTPGMSVCCSKRAQEPENSMLYFLLLLLLLCVVATASLQKSATFSNSSACLPVFLHSTSSSIVLVHSSP